MISKMLLLITFELINSIGSYNFKMDNNAK
jgi:hypothetical protein